MYNSCSLCSWPSERLVASEGESIILALNAFILEGIADLIRCAASGHSPLQKLVPETGVEPALEAKGVTVNAKGAQ